jgi:type I restriction enzyme S subunit
VSRDTRAISKANSEDQQEQTDQPIQRPMPTREEYLDMLRADADVVTRASRHVKLLRWDAKYADSDAPFDQENGIPLGEFITRRIEEFDKESCEFYELPMVSISFDGEITRREVTKPVKGKLYKAYPGDIVFSKIDVRMGAVAVVPEDFGTVAVTAEFPVYEVDSNKAYPEYIKMLIRHPRFRRWLRATASGTSGRKRAQPEKMEKVSVPLLEKGLQRQLLQRIEQARAKIQEAQSEYQESIRKMQVALEGLGIDDDALAQSNQ